MALAHCTECNCTATLGPDELFCGECGHAASSHVSSEPALEPQAPTPPTVAPPISGPAQTIAVGSAPPLPDVIPPVELQSMRRPGGGMARRPLHFFFLADCSGSMAVDGKIQALNNAIREAIPPMQQVAADNPNAQVLVRVLAFSDSARWHVEQPTPVEQFKWSDLVAGGVTDMGQALTLLAGELHIPPMTDRALPPVLVLISDGRPTDDFSAGLKSLLSEPWGVKAVRVAIAIGVDADTEVLQQFIGDTGLVPLQANNPDALVNHIKWASTAVLKSASTPASQTAGATTLGVNVPIPAPAAEVPAVSDVW